MSTGSSLSTASNLKMTSEVEFPSPFDIHDRSPVTLVELRMRYFSGRIRQKPNWWVKVFDDSIVAAWRREIVEHDCSRVDELWGGEERFNFGDEDEDDPQVKRWPRDPMTDAQLNYVFDELRYDASQMDEEYGIYPAAVDMVSESQCLIKPSLKARLLEDVANLENVPDEEKDWHPESDNEVLDLIHPSLHFFRIGRTHVVGRTDTVHVTRPISFLEYEEDRPDLRDDATSYHNQWLPTDFEVSSTGRVRPLGYINNLHPLEHREMYSTISAILERFIPLLQRTVSDALRTSRPFAIEARPMEWYDDIPEPGRDADPEVWREWEEKEKWPVVPDPLPFVPPRQNERVTLSLKGRILQVIVKLANIVLTPDKPTYPGGSWHVEGMSNESIVATGLYYHTCENITESRLDFRWTLSHGDDSFDSHLDYQQDDHKGFMVVYGLGRNVVLNQELGGIVAQEGKCVAFPNVYQHCVAPFELADKSRPGHRKILCFFLVDPTVRVLSTSDVPPQQTAWWDGIAQMVMPELAALPQELFDKIMMYVREGAMSRDEAEQEREELMGERSAFTDDHSWDFYEVKFNMCEH